MGARKSVIEVRVAIDLSAGTFSLEAFDADGQRYYATSTPAGPPKELLGQVLQKLIEAWNQNERHIDLFVRHPGGIITDAPPPASPKRPPSPKPPPSPKKGPRKGSKRK
jgi:hypothetical protein